MANLKFYHDEAEFAVINERIRRGDIVGIKGRPSWFLFCHWKIII